MGRSAWENAPVCKNLALKAAYKGLRLNLQQPLVRGVSYCRRTRADVETGEDISYMTVDCVPAQSKLLGYLLIAHTLRDKPEHFPLARRENLLPPILA